MHGEDPFLKAGRERAEEEKKVEGGAVYIHNSCKGRHAKHSGGEGRGGGGAGGGGGGGGGRVSLVPC